MTNVRVEIDRLVLTGWSLSASEAVAVQTALEAELGRLFAAEGAGSLPGGATDRVSGGSVTWALGGDAAALGAQVAQSVYGSLGR